MHQERQVRAKADLYKIEEHFSQDQEVTWIILGLKDELPPDEIRAMSNMTQKEYDTAKRRFRRGIEKIFPEKRSA
jgi:predicted RND superfamily exporter protein